MALIDDVKAICARLANAGWRELLLKHGLDIRQSSSANLKAALEQQLTIDRSVPGFEDFVSDTAQGIEPGNVAESLLYHAFASPHVQRSPSTEAGLGAMSTELAEFPTLQELDTVENYIFASADRSLEEIGEFAKDLLQAPNEVELVIAVFALEYRPSQGTPHQRHADLCLSRTGVSRVGNTSPFFDEKLRGFMPFVDSDVENAIRVLPCRYSAWLAVKSKVKADRFGPARPDSRQDQDSSYWVPIHKLFSGVECIRGLDLTVDLQAAHENRKIERIHRHMELKGVPSGFTAAQRELEPFVKRHGLANWDETYQGGKLLSPIPQPLAERASFEGEDLSFESPPMSNQFSDAFSPTFSLDVPAVPVRPWPEYAHVRFAVENGNVNYYGDQDNAEQIATAGGFRALNISDSTADGFIKATVDGIGALEAVPAYSLVAAPDFFPGVSQREVFDWWQETQLPAAQPSLPNWLREIIADGDWNFWRRPPVPLSDTEFGPNVNLANSGFQDDDITVTAVLTPLQEIDLTKPEPEMAVTLRHASLPDSAAGIFAPGWDVSGDRVDGSPNIHLSAYGLGSPFPEDAKLCAALSTFWPAAAPDTTRTYFDVDFDVGTVCPLTDEENGAAPASVAWDGVQGPVVLSENSQLTRVRFQNYPLADYTLNALEGKFSIAETRKITLNEYTNRILATLRMYRTLSEIGNKQTLHILSFNKVESTNSLLLEAENALGFQLSGPVFRFDVFANADTSEINSGEIRFEDFEVTRIFTLLIGQNEQLAVMARQGDGTQARSEWIPVPNSVPQV